MSRRTYVMLVEIPKHLPNEDHIKIHETFSKIVKTISLVMSHVLMRNVLQYIGDLPNEMINHKHVH